MTSGAKARLVALTQGLSANWELTKDSWSDAKSQEFEKKYLQELFTAVNATATNLEALERVLTKIQQDCE